MATRSPHSPTFTLPSDFDSNVGEINAAIFFFPLLLALLIEGPLLVFAERFRREFVLAAGLSGMGLSLALCALSPNLLAFAVAFALYAPSSGIACGIAQAALMDADPEHREAADDAMGCGGLYGRLARSGAGRCRLDIALRKSWIDARVHA